MTDKKSKKKIKKYMSKRKIRKYTKNVVAKSTLGFRGINTIFGDRLKGIIKSVRNSTLASYAGIENRADMLLFANYLATLGSQNTSGNYTYGLVDTTGTATQVGLKHMALYYQKFRVKRVVYKLTFDNSQSTKTTDIYIAPFAQSTGAGLPVISPGVNNPWEHNHSKNFRLASENSNKGQRTITYYVDPVKAGLDPKQYGYGDVNYIGSLNTSAPYATDPLYAFGIQVVAVCEDALIGPVNAVPFKIEQYSYIEFFQPRQNTL